MALNLRIGWTSMGMEPKRYRLTCRSLWVRLLRLQPSLTLTMLGLWSLDNHRLGTSCFAFRHQSPGIARNKTQWRHRHLVQSLLSHILVLKQLSLCDLNFECLESLWMGPLMFSVTTTALSIFLRGQSLS